MALPSHLWLPEGLVELPGTMPGPGPRRRRAVLRGPEGLPDRAVLLEWLGGPDLDALLADARGRTGACHVHLARVLRAGRTEDPNGRTGFVISEQTPGVDLLTVARAARTKGAPPWFVAAVLHAAGRGLAALHAHLASQGAPSPVHGALHPANIFIGWQGEVQLLAFSALLPDRAAPEAALSPGLLGPPSDVYGLCHLLAELAPEAAATLGALVGAGLSPRPEERPRLDEFLAGLSAYLLAEAPLQRRAAVAAVLAQLCPEESAGELGDVDLLGAWEDLWTGPAPQAAAEPPPLPPAPPALPARPRRRRHLADALLLGAAAVALASGLYFLGRALLF